MTAATERKILRWFHLLASIPIIGYFYGPVATIPEAAFTTRFIILPLVVLSGLWMWQGTSVKKYFRLKK